MSPPAENFLPPPLMSCADLGAAGTVATGGGWGWPPPELAELTVDDPEPAKDKKVNFKLNAATLKSF